MKLDLKLYIVELFFHKEIHDLHRLDPAENRAEINCRFSDQPVLFQDFQGFFHISAAADHKFQRILTAQKLQIGKEHLFFHAAVRCFIIHGKGRTFF